MGVDIKTMDIKKAQSTTEEVEQALGKRKVQDFVSDIKSEINKIHWTSREELLVYAKIVVISTLVFGLGIYCTDLIIQAVLSGLGFLVRLVLG